MNNRQANKPKLIFCSIFRTMNLLQMNEIQGASSASRGGKGVVGARIVKDSFFSFLWCNNSLGMKYKAHNVSSNEIQGP